MMAVIGAQSRRRAAAGFTLLELVIVLTILTLLIGSGMAVFPDMMESVRRGDTERHLNRIEKALATYQGAYGRLPCPSDVSLPESSPLFGVEAANPGSCRGGSPAATFGPAKKVVEGGIPYQALELPKEVAYDGWGRRIAYAVWAQMTEHNAFTTYSYQDAACGAITLRNDSTLPITNKALYVLVSFGADGHGGFRADGTRVNAGISDPMTLENCNCTAAGAATTWDTEYAFMHDKTATFDDHVRFKFRWQMQNLEQRMLKQWNSCIKGFRIIGAGSSRLGPIVMGDVNGDGIKDFIVANEFHGSVFVIFGGRPIPNPFFVSSLDGTNGFRLTTGGTTGASIAAGDVNGDGIDDMLLAVAGHTYIIFGKSTPWAASTNMGTLTNGSDGFRLSSGTGDTAHIVDVNGDGYGDIVVSARYASPGGRTQAGQMWVVYGKSSGWPGSFLLSSLDGSNGFTIEGEGYSSAQRDNFGRKVAVGDFNGDGKPDFFVQAGLEAGGGTTSGYIIFGKDDWTPGQFVVNELMDGIQGFRLYMPNIKGGVGVSDVNGDGFDDALFGYSGGPSSGVAVLFGSPDPVLPATRKEDVLEEDLTGDGSYGFRITGFGGFGTYTGTPIIGRADMNHDSIEDLVIAETTGSSPELRTGKMYAIPGRETGWAATMDKSSLNSSNSFFISDLMPGRNFANWMIYDAINVGSGERDAIMISAPRDSTQGPTDHGSVFVIYEPKNGWGSTFNLNELD